jgi:two-component system invasion response regulator UvrY
MQSPGIIRVALVDDHNLFRKGIAELINGFTGYSVQWEASHGGELIDKLAPNDSPDIVLLDVNMPEMNGYETALWLKQHHPTTLILALSMYDTEEAIIRMLKSGARGYLLKDAEPAELKAALHNLATKGFYYSDLVSGTLVSSIHKGEQGSKAQAGIELLNDREVQFLKLACTELTYKEIADQMCLAARTIDGYREALFEKLEVKSRVGLVVYAIKHGIVSVT